MMIAGTFVMASSALFLHSGFPGDTDGIYYSHDNRRGNVVGALSPIRHRNCAAGTCRSISGCCAAPLVPDEVSCAAPLFGTNDGTVLSGDRYAEYGHDVAYFRAYCNCQSDHSYFDAKMDVEGVQNKT